VRNPSKREIERFRDIENQGAWSLPSEALHKALPCDGCGRMPVVNPRWLIRDNPRYGAGRKYILGCPSAMWGGAEVYETLMEAIENWNYHVEFGGHNCVAR